MPASPFDRLLSPLQDLPKSMLLGVSGGVDSVSLLHALVSIEKKPIVLHFDHAWRVESREDALWVKKLAKHYRLPFFTARAPDSIRKTEGEARKARDLFFQKASRKFKCDHLVLAHHANDQVETFLLQLLRGSGSFGTGMESHVRRGHLHRYRPWLSVWKETILEYAHAHKLLWKEDATNQDKQHQRNWIRHELLPLLDQKTGRSVSPLLHRTAQVLKDQTKALLCRVESLSQQEKLKIRDLQTLSVAEQRLLIKNWLEFHQIPDVAFELIAKILDLLQLKSPAKVNLPQKKYVRRTAGKIWIDSSSSSFEVKI